MHGEQWQCGSVGADSETERHWDNSENVGFLPQRTQFSKTYPNQSHSEFVLHWLQRVLVHSSISTKWKWSNRSIITQHYHCSEWNRNCTTPKSNYQVAIGNNLIFHSWNISQFQWLFQSWCLYLLNSS
jgi:hypothetical protein